MTWPDSAFTISTSDESVADFGDTGTNATRALALGLRLHPNQEPQFGLEDTFGALGLPERAATMPTLKFRQDVIDESDALISNAGLEPNFFGLRQGTDGLAEMGRARQTLWNAVRQSESPAPSLAWLRVVLEDPSDEVAAAAAAALGRFRLPSGFGENAQDPFARAREVTRALRDSPSPAAREIADAASGGGIRLRGPRDPERDLDVSYTPDSSLARQESVSTMIHGTFGWRGTWWYPGGDFHSFIRNGARPDTYAGGRPFSWSGWYSKKSRAVATERFARWVTDGSSSRVNAVFAHSYGGAIALSSTTHGVRMNDLVLLSVPVHSDYDVEWSHIQRPQSVRIQFDLVLAAARARQRFGANVQEHVVPAYSWEHSVTHDPNFWAEHDLQRRLNL